jgi:predicted 3-demethylubiquinone-9 3-methyltransferase (glyoxalase superfamily)
MSLQKIIPNLWFDHEALDAARFYASIFPDGRLTSKVTLHDIPSGDTDVVSFELAGYSFMAINGGPLFALNPSISFFLNFDPSKERDAKEHLDRMWEKLSEGGTVLMPLGEYPFSPHYGWVQDRYGVSWQLILTDPKGEERPFIIPALLFTGKGAGKAEEAVNWYQSLFNASKWGALARYPEGMEHDAPGSLMFSDFQLEGQWFVAMDSGYPHAFQFNEAVSLMVNCDTQEEVDRLWEILSYDPEAAQCGWLKDRYGLSWQIVPSSMDEMMREGTPEQVDRMGRAVLTMTKLDENLIRKSFEE